MTVLYRNANTEAAPGEMIPTYYLFPGQIFTAAEPVLVTTILGSCIAVCLWDPEAGVGGVNHFLLARNPMRGAADARYGDTAMDRLLEKVIGHGAVPRRLLARIVGGACVVAGLNAGRGSIGEQNILVAREFLQRQRIAVEEEQTGGTSGRKLRFHTGNGSSSVKEI